MVERSSFTVDEAGVRELFQKRGEPVRDHVESLAKRTTVLAKRYVGKRTGALAASIGYHVVNGALGGVEAYVEASNRIALLHHEGSRPHIILPRHGRTLRIKQGGRVVYVQMVRHPGTKPNPYLVTALRQVVTT